MTGGGLDVGSIVTSGLTQVTDAIQSNAPAALGIGAGLLALSVVWGLVRKYSKSGK